MKIKWKMTFKLVVYRAHIQIIKYIHDNAVSYWASILFLGDDLIVKGGRDCQFHECSEGGRDNQATLNTTECFLMLPRATSTFLVSNRTGPNPKS